MEEALYTAATIGFIIGIFTTMLCVWIWSKRR